MSTLQWISVKDKLPVDKQYVWFTHHGYKFKGYFHNRKCICLDPLIPRPIEPDWYFTGSQEGSTSTVTTYEVEEWMPLPESAEEE